MKLAYLLFKDAPQLKTKGEPDEAIADIRVLTDGKSMPLPWINATAMQMAEYQMSISEVMLAWESTQPYLVEISKGKREEWTLQEQPSGEHVLRPKPVLDEPV